MGSYQTYFICTEHFVEFAKEGSPAAEYASLAMDVTMIEILPLSLQDVHLVDQ